MNTKLRIAVALGGLAFAPLAAAQVTFYEQESFQGRSFTAQQQRVNNFQRYGFNDRASSAVVVGSRWEVCSDSRFEGRCAVLRPGRYPSLASLGLNDRVSSARAVNANARIDDNRYAPMPMAAGITFYENEGFGGRSFSPESRVDNFQRAGFNDRASSVEVIGDRFEVCDDAGFRGNCKVLRPGRYASLRSMGLNDRISSVRAVSPATRVDDNRYAPAYSPQADSAPRDYRRRGQERLYQANVTYVRAVVGAPEQRCWIERENVPQSATSNINVPGAVGGAVIGGIIGHQVGGGNKDLATAGGAVIGGLVGANINRGSNQPQTQDVQKCASAPSQTPTYWDVSYNFRGQDHRVQMTSQPGQTVTVNEQGEPRS
jgi:uncharacterized protein YcfJ